MELGVLWKILRGKASLHYIRIRTVMQQALMGLTCNQLMDFDQIVVNYPGERYQAYLCLLVSLAFKWLSVCLRL